MSSKKESGQKLETHQTVISVKPNKHSCSTERIVDFSITTDSVVAKATIVTDDDTGSLEIRWGDGERDTLTFSDLNRVKTPSPTSNLDPLPPNTYEFYHRYAVTYINIIGRAPPGKFYPKAEEYVVNVLTRDKTGEFDYKSKRIIIKPKYKINFYSLSAGNISQCDNGSLNEFTTVQMVEGEVKNEWDWRSSDNLLYKIPTHRFDGSHLSKIFEVTEITSPVPHATIDRVSFTFTEKDDRYDETGGISYPASLDRYRDDKEESASGRLGGTFIIRDNSIFGFSCTLVFGVDWELKLLVPIPKYTWPMAMQ